MSNIDKTYFQSQTNNFDLLAIGYIIYKNIKFVIYALLISIIITVYIYSTKDTVYMQQTVVTKASNLNFILSQEAQKMLNSNSFSTEDILDQFNGNIISNDIFLKTLNDTNVIIESDSNKIDPKGIKLAKNDLGEADITITSTFSASDGNAFTINLIKNAYNLTLSDLILALKLNEMELKKKINQKRIAKKLEIDDRKLVLQNRLKALKKEFNLTNKAKKDGLLSQKEIAEELSYDDPQTEVIKKHIIGEVSIANSLNSGTSSQLLNSMLPYYFYGTKVIDKEIELIKIDNFMSFDDEVVANMVELEYLDNTFNDAYIEGMTEALENYESFIRVENEIKELFLISDDLSKIKHRVVNFDLNRIYTTQVHKGFVIALFISLIVSLFMGSIIALIYHEYKTRDFSKII